MSDFTFNGVSASSKGLHIESVPRYVTGQRIVETYQIAGRNGAKTRDTGVFTNASMTYMVYLDAHLSNTASAAREIAAWLLGPTGYCVLSDTYDSTIYRKALYVGPMDLENWLMEYGRATLTFSCLPQRFLNSGDTPVSITSGQTLSNAYQRAKPLISLTGTGNAVLTIGDKEVDITGMTGHLIIDCEEMNAYYNDQNLNSQISVPDGFPVLEPGTTTVTFTGGITGCAITPRWWTI